MTSGGSRERFSEQAPRSCGVFENFADADLSLMSASENAEKSCSWPEFRLFPSRSSDSFETDSSTGYSAYESFDCATPNNEHENGGYDVHPAAWTDDMMLGWRLPNRKSSGRSRSPLSDSGRSECVSFNDFSAPSTSFTTSYTRPAPIGSRGRAVSVHVEHLHGARGGDTAAECRAKSRGFCGLRGAGSTQNVCSNVPVPVFCGTKRKMMAPVYPSKFVKKPKVVRTTPNMGIGAALNLTWDSHISSDGKDLSTEEDKKVRVREKRRRRREKNREKYGEKHREHISHPWGADHEKKAMSFETVNYNDFITEKEVLPFFTTCLRTPFPVMKSQLAFTCAFCKFRTFDGQDIEKHFGGTYHRETLDYIRRHAKFDDRVISFLHDCMVHKFRKTVSALCNLHTFSDQKMNQKVMEGVTEDDYMRKMEVVHCMACDMHIPAFFTSVQQHLSSPVHLKRRVVYKEQLKRESVLTAKAIINNNSVKVRYEKYIKGEDPFVNDAKEDTSSDSSEQERPDEPDEPEDKVDSSD